MKVLKPARCSHIVELAEKVARETVLPLAAKYDREGRFPVEIYEALKAVGLTAMRVPTSMGGLGASLPIYGQAIKTIARACGSTALTLNMHSSVVHIVNRMGDPDQRSRYLKEAAEGKLFASLTSEPASSFRGKFSVQTTAEKVSGGYVLNGQKFFCSLSTGADYFFVWAMPQEGGDLRNDLLNILVPADAEGVRIEETWDAMAMRATASHSVQFKDVFVPEDALIGGPGGVVRHELTDAFMPGYVATYLGLAEAAYEYAVDFVMKKKPQPGETPIREHAVIQQHIARMNMTISSAQLFMERAMELAEGEDRKEAILALNQAKYAAAEAARSVADAALQVVGGRALYRHFPLERIMRDAHVGVVMPPNHDQTLETIGRICLGMEVSGGFLNE